MIIVLLVLGLLYAALVGVLFAAGASGVVIILVVGGLALAQLFLSDKIGLAAMGAKEVGADQAPSLHAMIERLCLQADLPKPKIAVADTQMPNAFAMGRSPKSATVCVTTGLMQMLNPAELEGVLAHELTHVKNRDVLVMTIASFFASIAALITQFGFFFGGGFGDGEGDGDNVPFAVILLVSFAVYILSFFLMLTLSRYREYGADKGSALITGRPSALSSALLKISGAMDAVPEKDLRAAQNLSAFFIAAPVKSTVQTLFMDHPPTQKRIERLQRYESELQSAGRIAA
jgi:heat shock protein HtpX